MDYGTNHIGGIERPDEVAHTRIETKNREINTYSEIDNANKFNNEITKNTDNLNETTQENVDASKTTVTSERSLPTNEYTEQQTKVITGEAKSIEFKTDDIPASTAIINKIMTIHESAEAQTTSVNGGNNINASNNSDTQINNVNKEPTLYTNQTEATSINDESNLLFPNSHLMHLSFMSNTLHVSPEETKRIHTDPAYEKQITIINDVDEEEDVTKSVDKKDTPRGHDYTEVKKTVNKVIDTKSNNETEITKNPFKNATKPTTVNSIKQEDRCNNNTNPTNINNEDNQTNTIVITETESSKEQSTVAYESPIVPAGDKKLEEKKKPGNAMSKKVTETETLKPTDKIVIIDEKGKNRSTDINTKTIEIENEDTRVENTDKMDIDIDSGLQGEKCKTGVIEDNQYEALKDATKVDIVNLSNISQISDNKSFDNQAAEIQLEEPTPAIDHATNEPSTTESTDETRLNNKLSKDGDDNVYRVQRNETDAKVEHTVRKNQDSTKMDKTSQPDIPKPISIEISLLKEQHIANSSKITSLTEQLDKMNTRCKVLEDELLKSNTTISESLSSISILMQKFVKNQDTLKREVDTVKKSQLKIDVKNVKNVTKRTRREGMIMEEGDVEYRVISRNLSNRRTSSQHDSNEPRKRRHLLTDTPQHSPEPKAQIPKPKPTKVQRVATEIFEKSQSAFGAVEKPAIDLASSLKMATTNDTIDFSKGKSPQKSPKSQLYAKAAAASMKLVRTKTGKNNINVYEQVPSGPGIQHSAEKIETSNHASLLNLTTSPSNHEQLDTPQRKISSNLVELKHEQRILGQPLPIRRSSSSEALSSFIKPEAVAKKVSSKNKQIITVPVPVPVLEPEDDYDPNGQFNDIAVEANDDYVPQVETKKIPDNEVVNTGKITAAEDTGTVPAESNQVDAIPEEDSEQLKRKPTVKGFKLVLAGKFRKSIQLYIVDNIIYTGESPYSAISFVYFVDLKYSNVRKTRETTTTNFSIGFPHILIDEGDKAMEVLGSNIMTPGYLMTVEYFLGDYLQACHLVEEKLSPGCTTDYWRRCRNLFLLLMYWRQLAREKRGFRRYTMLHAVKEIENFRLHAQPKSYAISEPFFLDKKEQERIASSGKPREWMYQVEKTLPFIGQNGITEANINAALDALLKPPPDMPNFIPYASIIVPTGVDVV